MGRRLSEWERLDRKKKVAERDMSKAAAEVEKLERQLAMIEAGEMATTDRDYFSRKHSGALVKVRNMRSRFEEAESELEAYEASMARFRQEPDETHKGPVLEGESVASEVERIKREAGLQT